MNGFEQIKSFYSWVFNNPDKAKPTHISLYLFLLNQNNRSMWVEWFKCPYDLAMQGSCIGSKSTYYKCLKELQSFGLINYREGVNNFKSPLINLVCLYKNEPQTEQVTVPLSEHLSEPHTEPLSVQLTGNIYKLITNNIKLINYNESHFENFLNSLKKNEEDPKEKSKHEIFAEDLLKSETWTDALRMQNKLSLEELDKWLKVFNVKMVSELINKNTKSEYASHFSRWLPTEIEKSKKNKLLGPQQKNGEINLIHVNNG